MRLAHLRWRRTYPYSLGHPGNRLDFRPFTSTRKLKIRTTILAKFFALRRLFGPVQCA